MQKITRIFLKTILLTVFGLTAQTLTATGQTPDSANDFPTIRVVSQRLEKTLDALEKAETALKDAEAVNAKLKQLSVLNDEIIAKKDTAIAEQEKLIKILEKQTRRKLSLLFGLVKITY